MRAGTCRNSCLPREFAFVVMEVVKWVWGTEPLPVPIPAALSGAVNIVGNVYPAYRLFILFFSIVVLAFMAYILMKTRLGITVRAAVADRDMVSALGTNTPRVFMLVMASGPGWPDWPGSLPGLSSAPTRAWPERSWWIASWSPLPGGWEAWSERWSRLFSSDSSPPSEFS